MERGSVIFSSSWRRLFGVEVFSPGFDASFLNESFISLF